MLLRPESSRGPKPAPLLLSLTVHASVIAWLFFVPSAGPRKKPQSLYEREIAPHEKKLVWYRFNKQLPEVSPMKPPARKEPRPKPVRATVKHPKQSIAAKSPSHDEVKQMTLAPGPELKIPHELEAPNLMAFKMPEPPAPPKQPKPFTAPPEPEHPTATPELEKGPEIAAQLPAPPAEIPVPRPAPRQFTPPPQIAKSVETPRLQPGQAIVETDKPDSGVLRIFAAASQAGSQGVQASSPDRAPKQSCGYFERRSRARSASSESSADGGDRRPCLAARPAAAEAFRASAPAAAERAGIEFAGARHPAHAGVQSERRCGRPESDRSDAGASRGFTARAILRRAGNLAERRGCGTGQLRQHRHVRSDDSRRRSEGGNTSAA